MGVKAESLKLMRNKVKPFCSTSALMHATHVRRKSDMNRTMADPSPLHITEKVSKGSNSRIILRINEEKKLDRTSTHFNSYLNSRKNSLSLSKGPSNDKVS